MFNNLFQNLHIGMDIHIWIATWFFSKHNFNCLLLEVFASVFTVSIFSGQPSQTFHHKSLTRFHVRFVRHLYLLWKLIFMSSIINAQHATYLIQTLLCAVYDRKNTKLLLISAFQWQLMRQKCNLQNSNDMCLCYLMFLDYLR